jgi:hypothetical protein
MNGGELILGLGVRLGVGFLQYGNLTFESVSATGVLSFDGDTQDGVLSRERV